MTLKSRAKNLFTTTSLAAAVGAGALSIWAIQATPQTDARISTAEPPAVEIAVIEPRAVRLWAEFSARLQAVEEVGLRPQVSGTIVEVRDTLAEFLASRTT